jgi:hypothetical protein
VEYLAKDETPNGSPHNRAGCATCIEVDRDIEAMRRAQQH